jgi:hypothetical protein
MPQVVTESFASRCLLQRRDIELDGLVNPTDRGKSATGKLTKIILLMADFLGMLHSADSG